MIKHDVYTVSVESAGDEDGGSADNMSTNIMWKTGESKRSTKGKAEA